MIRHAIDAAREAGARPVIVVTGHEAEAVRAAAGRDVVFVDNPDYGEGLSTSLRTGIAAVPEECDGALVALGDMPRVGRSEEHTSELQSLMRISYAVFCLKKKKNNN